MGQLFRAVEQIDGCNTHNEDIDDESTESVIPVRCYSWLVTRFVEEYKVQAAHFAATPRLQSLIEEYIDLIETDYFESALHDLLDSSYHQTMRTYLLESLSQPLLADST